MASLLGVAGCLPQTPRGTEPAAYETSRQAFTTGPGIPNAVKPSGTALGANIITSVSPSNSANPKVMSPGKHFLFSSIVNKSLFIGGNASHEILEHLEPDLPGAHDQPVGYLPDQRHRALPGTCELVSPHRGGEAESHQHSFSLFPDGSIHAVTISGRGIDIWNISNPAEPRWESSTEISGVNYGDSTAAVWGVFFQGKYIYVGGTNTGLHVFDATNPQNPIKKKTMSVSAMGNVSSGMIGRWATC